MSSNRVVGDALLQTRSLSGYFWQPATMYDGCINRLKAPDAGVNWWTLQRQIENNQNKIVELMYDLYGNDWCKSKQQSLFDQEKFRQKDDFSDIVSSLLGEEEYLLDADYRALLQGTTLATRAKATSKSFW